MGLCNKFFNESRMYVLVYYSVNLCSHYFWKKVLEPNGPYITTSHTIIRNVYLLVILEFCLFLLFSVGRLKPTSAYVEEMKYLFKNAVFYPRLSKIKNPATLRSLIFETLCSETIALNLKNIT